MLKLNQILDVINPVQDCYKIIMFKEQTTVYVNYHELHTYGECYVKAISGYREGNREMLSFVLRKP